MYIPATSTTWWIMLQGKKIILGITGGIAAYKAAELTRELVRSGAVVKVIMTANAAEFITPLTMQTLSRNPVYTKMFEPLEQTGVEHISLAQEAELVVVAPATANLLGKVRAGIADDLLTTTIMATKAPVIFSPAMNSNMWDNPIVRDNVAGLRQRGYHFIEPCSGELACNTEGAGRLPPIAEIVEEIEKVFSRKDLVDQEILITAGPTREPFDPVRYITNHSSGKMGYALARMANRRGARVTLVSGPTNLPPPVGVNYFQVSTALEMREAVLAHFDRATVIIKAAAVADYRPGNYSRQKVKKDEGPIMLTLERNPDIIAELGNVKGSRLLIGFAMETDDLITNAREKLQKKNMDLIVANHLREEGAGFDGDTNVVTILYPDGESRSLPRMDKGLVADEILNIIRELLDKRRA